MNNELDILTDWFRANKLSLNVSKTNFMLFTNSNHNKTYSLQLAGQQITQSQCVKFLGMHIDNCLKWDKHIKKMKQKISQSMYAIIRARSILTRENLMTLYYSMVYPYLSYGIALWGGSYKVHTSQLEIMQKKIIRIIENVPINSHTALLFKNTLSILSGCSPEPLHAIFVISQGQHNHGTRHSQAFKIHVPKIRTSIANMSIVKMAPLLWNSLNQNLYFNTRHALVNKHCFSSRFKRWTMREYN